MDHGAGTQSTWGIFWKISTFHWFLRQIAKCSAWTFYYLVHSNNSNILTPSPLQIFKEKKLPWAKIIVLFLRCIFHRNQEICFPFVKVLFLEHFLFLNSRFVCWQRKCLTSPSPAARGRGWWSSAAPPGRSVRDNPPA